MQPGKESRKRIRFDRQFKKERKEAFHKTSASQKHQISFLHNNSHTVYQLFTTQGTDILLSTITVRPRTHSHTHPPISPPGHLNTTTMGAIKSFFSRVFYGLITGAILGATFAILLGIVLGLIIGVILGVVLTIPLALLAAIILGLIAGASEGAVEFVANGLRNARDAILGLIDAGLSLLQGPKED